jgi:geranylgeranyl diphosphate synthase type I
MDLYRMMSYHLGWEDERGSARDRVAGTRSHGVACLTACHTAGGDVEAALPAAASVELVNSFCQIHDDVQGGHPRRDDRDAVWWVWGPAQAINAGDAMHAMARLAMFRLQERGISPLAVTRALQLVDEASLKLCEGRFQDLEAQERIDLKVDAYLEMAASKTGALYACAMRLGGLVAEADEDVVDALARCGASLGMAVQVRDDLRELWPDSQEEYTPSAEVLNKKKLLPVVYAVEKAALSQKRRLGDIYFKRVLEPEDISSVRVILEELGAREYSEELLGKYRAEAEAAVDIPQIPREGAAAIGRFVESALGA